MMKTGTHAREAACNSYSSNYNKNEKKPNKYLSNIVTNIIYVSKFIISRKNPWNLVKFKCNDVTVHKHYRTYLVTFIPISNFCDG